MGKKPDPDMEDMQRLGQGMTPFAKEIAEFARSRLPEGVHFGVFVLVPTALRPAPGEARGRLPIVAITSDRDIMGPAVAYWVMSVLGRQPEGDG